MDISNVYGSSGALLVESLYGDKTQSASDENSASVFPWGADSVSISAEAWEKLAAMSDDSAGEEESQSQTDEDSGTVAASGSGGGGGGASSDSASKIESLRSRLASLQTSLGQASGSEAASLSAQIGQVMAEIAALESEAA